MTREHASRSIHMATSTFNKFITLYRQLTPPAPLTYQAHGRVLFPQDVVALIGRAAQRCHDTPHLTRRAALETELAALPPRAADQLETEHLADDIGQELDVVQPDVGELTRVLSGCEQRLSHLEQQLTAQGALLTEILRRTPDRTA